ncbi:hypothetical protein PL8927_330065 [Planktothrix serta PCC 8927]|uniref:Uncharacterized protein n=1 Tax=Planktothrix serta PCC 8927 TaxID=671068 RepID=A0A7Z9DWH8_9CYAN|nr:hypothetical protein [Planktothrix serta]VXD14939.1 hypothetical protein PL8927_330065 [Planktothrix serta PCC 8927]
MEKLSEFQEKYSQKEELLNPPIKASNQRDLDQKKSSIVGSPWYTILVIYSILLSFTGGVTFFYNNAFASREEHIKNLDLMKTSEQLDVYQELLEVEIQNMENVNNIANQSFNVILGSLLGFLSATLTTLSSKDDEIADSHDSILESKPEPPEN